VGYRGFSPTGNAVLLPRGHLLGHGPMAGSMGSPGREPVADDIPWARLHWGR